MARSSTSPARRRQRWVAGFIAAIIVVPVAWYLGAPLFVSQTVNEASPLGAGATVPPGMTRQQAETVMMQASKVNVTLAEAMPPGGAPAAALRRGSFTNGDSFHKGEGTATIYRTGEGLVLRFDPFKVTNGPNLYVYLSGHPMPRTTPQLHAGGGAVEVTRLKGNIGAQNYSLPSGLDVSTIKSVVIYCKMFSVIVSTAEMVAP